MLDEYHVFAENLVLSYDYQRNVSVYSGQLPPAYRCPNPDHCLGGIESGCLNGTTGPLCSVCGPGYSELNSNCVTCPESAAQSVLLSMFFFLAIAVFGAMFFRYNVKAIVSTLRVNAKRFQDADDAAVFHEERLKSHMHDTEELTHCELEYAREVGMAMSDGSINRHELKILASRRKALGVSVERHGMIVKAVQAEHALHAQPWYAAQIMTVLKIFIQYLQIFAMITAVYTGVDWSASQRLFASPAVILSSNPSQVSMLSCVSSTLALGGYGQFWASLLMPITGFGSIALYYAAKARSAKPESLFCKKHTCRQSGCALVKETEADFCGGSRCTGDGTGGADGTVPKKLPSVEPVATKTALCQASSCSHYRVIDGIRQLRASCTTNAALLFFLICKPVFLKLLLKTSALFRLFHSAL